jgi:hypothetical protein
MTNRLGEVVTTAVTNLDIHDIARSARTYGLKGYFLVTPIALQRELVGRILGHWQEEKSREYHPDRYEALSLAKVVPDFEAVKAEVKARHGEEPEVVLTDARPLPNSIRYSDLRRELEAETPKRTRPLVLVFGTGWGVSEAFYPEVHRILVPVYGPEGKEGYNHLSVRAAVAIILDRLLGK